MIVTSTILYSLEMKGRAVAPLALPGRGAGAVEANFDLVWVAEKEERKRKKRRKKEEKKRKKYCCLHALSPNVGERI